MIIIKQLPRFKRLLSIIVLSLGLSLITAIPCLTAPSASAYWWDELATPVISSATNTDRGVKLTWEPVFRAEKYRVFVKNGSSWKGLGNTTGTTFYHTAAESGKTYTYTVRCISRDGSYFTSDYVRSGKSITFIKMPVINKLSNLENSVSIGWDAVAGAAKYRVFIKNGTSWKKIGDTTANTFVHKNVVSGTKYTYTVRCLSKDGKSYTSAYYAAGKSITFVKAPTVTSITDEPTGVRIKWNACAGADKYRVYIRSGNSWKTIAETADTSYLHYADNDTESTYTLRCFNANGKAVSWYHEAGWTHLYSFTGTLDAPVISGIENTENGAMIRWDPVPGAEKYRVLIRGYYTWNLLGDTTETSFLHADAESGVTYTYTVCCIDAESSRNTSVYDNTGKSNLFVATPVIKRLVNSSIGPLISWDACPGAFAYRLVNGRNGVWDVLAETTEPAYVHIDAAESVTYTYKVICLDEEGKTISAIPSSGKSIGCTRNAASPVYTNAIFADDIAAALGEEPVAVTDPNAPLTRLNAARILVKALRYRSRTAITVSDSDSPELKTIAYYGYFTPDSKDRLLPSRYVTTAEHDRIMAELARRVNLQGKHILAFGDSIMYGKGNSGSGIVRMLAEKYNMGFTSYAYNGASFGTQNSRKHIIDEINDAAQAGCVADIILINGGTNDMSLVANGSSTDSFNPNYPDKSTMAVGMKQAMAAIMQNWQDVPVIYIRAHNMDKCSDTLERQMGECAVRIAQESGAAVVDIYSDTTLNTKSSTQCARYTVDSSGSPDGDGTHPNALCYANFYLPLIGAKTEELLTQ